jgi:hypothetical protein
MRRRNRYRPAWDELEGRVVLNHGVHRNPSVLLNGLHPGTDTVRPGGRQSIIALTNKAFDLFQQDYAQARATYLAAAATSPAPMTATQVTAPQQAFMNYTTARINVLAQEIVSNMLMTPLVNTPQSSRGVSLPGLVNRRINGVSSTNNVTSFLPGTLGQQLTNAIPPPGSSAAVAGLDSLAQDQAIEAARVGVVNGLNIIKNGDFGNHPVKH